MMLPFVVTTASVIAGVFLQLLMVQRPSVIILVAAEKQLKQIHVINRHGSRTMLPKNADTLIEEDGATLTPLGQTQLYMLGSWLRQTYLGQIEDLRYYNPSFHRLESTNLDRALSSANSMALGLFPLAERATGLLVEDENNTLAPALVTSSLEYPPAIPLYSIEEINDVYLRPFRNCPTFQDNLILLYETSAWKELENKHDDLLRTLANIFPENAEDGKVPLKEVWNVYDAIHVAVTECTDNEMSCDALVPLPSLATALSVQDFLVLELLTHQAEHMKYAETETAGNLLGSNLLWRILERASSDEIGGTFFLYSAHAATLLGLLSTLQADEGFVIATQGERFVDYGSALVVEIYQEMQDGGVMETLSLKLKYVPSISSLEEDAMSIPLTFCGADDLEDSTAFCDLTELTEWAVENTLVTTEHWCEACGNNHSDVCLRSMYAKEEEEKEQQGDGSVGWDSLGEVEVATTSTSADNRNDALILTATFLGGLVAGLIVTVLVGYLYGCTAKTKIHDPISHPTNDKVVPTHALDTEANPPRNTNDIVVADSDKNDETPSENGNNTPLV
jgi:hypothetical protein